jgi:hypothetical protein
MMRSCAAIALRQGCAPPSQFGQVCPLMSCSTVTINRLLRTVDELLVAIRLREDVHRAGPERLHRHGNVLAATASTLR